MNYKLPTASKVLVKIKPHINKMIDVNKLKAQVIDVLNHFNIGIDRINVVVGARVILFKLNLAPGTKISKLKAVENEIALALASQSVRTNQLKDCVGIEIANPNPTIVSLLECITELEIQDHTGESLPMILGKDIDGKTKTVFLNEMPHLLVAGATGQGKSVFINNVLSYFLLTMLPSDLKLLLIDPKRVELGVYNIAYAYLLKPVINEASEAIKALRSICFEMDDRYNLLQAVGARNINEYNKNVHRYDANRGHKHLPFIVVVIDEFADLMLTGGKEAETSIVRIAQLARAVGIHLIVATQRPSTDIISGLIKANFPTRIAFRTTSNMDSRTILDAGGAEDLLGNGDMLYSKGADLIRIQCPYISTDEVNEIVKYVSKQKFTDDNNFLINLD